MKKSLVLITALYASAALANSDDLASALANGKASGDVSVFYESRHINKGEKSVYYNNTAWAVGSVGLKFETDFYKNFKAVVGFRASAPLYEKDKNLKTLHGTGDSTERIYEDDRVLLSNLYLEYNAYDTAIKIGRQEMISDWIGKINDGVRITNNSVSNLTLDAMWTRAQGRAYLKEMWGFNKKRINKDDGGLFNLGATYKFDGGFGVKAYGLYAKDIFSGFGAKAMYDGQISDDLGLGGMLHYARSDEEKKNHDGKVLEATAYAKYLDNKFTLGYVKTGKEIGWGSLNMAGDQIVPFEEGDVMYERDVKTLYAMLSTKIEQLSITGLYGTTNYKLKGGDDTKYRQNELSVWLNYPIMKNLNAFVIYDQVFRAQKGYPSLRQVGAGLSYTF